MISIAYQANIGCYFFSYLLARWLASIRADVINLPQHPLLHLAERNLLSGIGAGEGGVGHGEVGWVGVWGEGGGENLGK